MRLFATYLLIFLALFLPLEDFILGMLPVTDITYLYMRQGSDFAVLIALAGLMALTATFQRGWRGLGRAPDFWLLTFLLLSAVTLVVNQAAIAPWFLNLKAMIRYVPAAYLLANSVGYPDLESRFRKVVFTAVGFQAALGVIGFLGGPSVAAQFVPREASAEVEGFKVGITGVREVGKGWVTGTQSNTIGFAFLMLIAMALVLAAERVRRRLWLPLATACAAVGGLLFLVYVSGSRAAFLIALALTGGWVLRGVNRIQRVVLIIGVVVAGFVLLVFASQAFVSTPLGEIFTARYLDAARGQRLGLLTDVLWAFINAPPVNLLLGFSADLALFGGYITRALDLPILLVANMRALEDVYWVALLYYYGLLGVGAWGMFIVSLFHALRVAATNGGPERRGLANAARLLLLVAIPLNMVNQAFEVKTFSFYLWAVVGLALRPAPEATSNLASTVPLEAARFGRGVQ